ncbi:MAG TPA: hypothetical protein VGZ02_07310 [Candidatus Baltobacteraceae bacterium]|nr:hypothetical protein [Candidatus Baltobacteraceae bacterium]
MTNAAFPVALSVRDRRCVIVAPPDDAEMHEREARLRAAGARLERLFAANEIDAYDLTGAFLVIARLDEARSAAKLFERSQRERFLLCCIDKPAFSSISMMAAASAGPVTISVSTGGSAPRIAKLLRVALQRAMDENFKQFTESVARFRQEVHREYPGPDNASRRIAAVLERVRGFRADVRLSYPRWFTEACEPEDTGTPELQPVRGYGR